MNAQQMLFLRDCVPAAQQAMRATGVPASVTIAQAIIESSNKKGWGQSSLALKANNYFGIKDTDHESYMEFPTTEYENGELVHVNARFEYYATPDLSFIAHARLLATAKRYRPCMAVKDDPLAFCDALEACGYSTNPQYAETLRKLIAQFDLTQYDVVAA